MTCYLWRDQFFKKLLLGVKCKFYDRPVLGYLIVGNDPQSEIYVKMKLKVCESIGIEYKGHSLESKVSEANVASLIEEMNCDDKINGILV